MNNFTQAFVFTLILYCLLIPATGALCQEEFSVSVIKVNKSYYANGEAFFLARCTVENMTDKAGNFYVRLAGLDNKDDRLHTLQLEGTIKRRGKKVLRHKNRMDAKTYKKIKKWIVNKAAFHSPETN